MISPLIVFITVHDAELKLVILVRSDLHNNTSIASSFMLLPGHSCLLLPRLLGDPKCSTTTFVHDQDPIAV